MSAAYRDARLKIRRAKKHIADFTAAVIALEDTCTATIEHHAEGGESLIHEIPNPRETLDDLALITGDALHNMRSALDFAWHSTISGFLPDKITNKTKFPVRRTRQDVEGALHGIEVDTRCIPLFECIMRDIQPYEGGHNEVAWTLNNIDNSDKHVLLLGLNPVAHITGITRRDANGQLDTGSSVQARGVNGRYIIDFPRGYKIEDKGKISIGILLQEAGIYYPVPIESLLSDFCNFSLYSVQLLENL